MFMECETLAANKEYQAIPDTIIERFKFKENYICDQFESVYIEYPIEVSRIICDKKPVCRSSNIGKFVSIMPCVKGCEVKSYLGLYLGDLPIGTNISYNPETKELITSFDTNPGIFVFALNKIVYGCESWWSVIESEDDFKDITQDAINEQWYMKVLNSLKVSTTGNG
jgi:hypothetical protein